MLSQVVPCKRLCWLRGFLTAGASSGVVSCPYSGVHISRHRRQPFRGIMGQRLRSPAARVNMQGKLWVHGKGSGKLTG